MTEHSEAVQRQRDMLAAEKWGEGVKYILGQDGYVETLYNSGKKVRVYTRGLNEGKTEVLEDPMSIEQMIISMSQAHADANIR